MPPAGAVAAYLSRIQGFRRLLVLTRIADWSLRGTLPFQLDHCDFSQARMVVQQVGGRVQTG
jgi:hypothetical protein